MAVRHINWIKLFQPEADASGLPLKHSHVESQECGTAPKRAVASSSDVPEDITDIQGLFSWINDVARAVEVPHENPSSSARGYFIAELPDNPRDSRELSTKAASGTPTDPFWGLPPSPGFLPELQCGVSELRPIVPPPSAQLSPQPAILAVSAPPSAQSAQPIEEVQQRQPQVVQAEKKNRGSTKRGGQAPCACPHPPERGELPAGAAHQQRPSQEKEAATAERKNSEKRPQTPVPREAVWGRRRSQQQRASGHCQRAACVPV
ncbi:uncharacterized protein LOC122191336 isoform X2 [Lagopus leucura]|uniref:uncharacterized protein LOC122191336 isoform X2 n=1 Tax=Lagopus leucura TaxID=30410 RepID=UPI001C6806A0|nr:uncharacterized protein LOC122191336 isoform X2 [Lagopus leucura]